MKTPNLFFIHGTSGLLLLWMAAFCLMGCGSQTNQDVATAPDTITQSNHSYFTANPETSQENSDNSSVNTTVSSEIDGTSTAKTAAKLSEKETTYTIRLYHGKIGVFRGNSSTPGRTLDVDPASLPKADRQALSGGITVTGNNALRRALEDYES